MDEHLKQLLSLGREHYQSRDFERAEEVLQQVLAETDRFADVYDMMGVIAHSRGNFAAAEAYFARAIELNPNYTEALLNLTVTYNDQGKYNEARHLYAALRKLSAEAGSVDPFAMGRIANMHAEIAHAYHDIGMLPEAIVELEKAVRLRPGFADLRTRLACLYRDSGDTLNARAQLQAAKTANPNYVQARVLLGVMLLTGGERALATAEFQAALDCDPDNKNAQMYLRLANSEPTRTLRPDAALPDAASDAPLVNTADIPTEVPG